MGTEHVPLSRLDLNLLVSLDALLTEGSVTRAAQRLHLSQPALSAALSRLRTHFDDPLLTRRGNEYELTPFAVMLAERTGPALDSARRVFETRAGWSAAESTREYSVYGSDYGFVTVGRVASDLAARRAPGVRFRFIQHNPGVVEDASARLRSADAMIIPHGPVSDLPHADLWRDEWVALVSAAHPTVSDALTMSDIARLPFVMTYQTRSAFTSVGRQIQQLGVELRVDVVLESFLPLPHFIVGTERVGFVQRALLPMIAHAGIRVVMLPFEATPISNALWWNPVHERDPAHRWMRDLFVEAGQLVSSGRPA